MKIKDPKYKIGQTVYNYEGIAYTVDAISINTFITLKGVEVTSIEYTCKEKRIGGFFSKQIKAVENTLFEDNIDILRSQLKSVQRRKADYEKEEARLNKLLGARE